MRNDYLKYLNEDGSLDIETIINLPLDEKIKVLPYMTPKQKEEYYSRLPVCKSWDGPVITGRYKMSERGVDAFEFLKKMRKKYGY